MIKEKRIFLKCYAVLELVPVKIFIIEWRLTMWGLFFCL